MSVRSSSDSARSSPRSKKRWAYPLSLMLLNSVDTHCTLVAVEYGATELNAIMAVVLAHGVLYFLLVKLVAVNILILFVGVIGQRYEVGRMGMSVTVWAYTFLTCYHAVNLSQLFLSVGRH